MERPKKRDKLVELEELAKLAERCAEAVQKISSWKFNNGQCDYLADKLKVVVHSASSFAEVSCAKCNGSSSSVDIALGVEIIKFLLALAKQVESFIQGCCKDSWIQAAMTLTNVSQYVSFLGLNLEFCRIAFCKECAATGGLTLDQVEDIKQIEVEIVNKRASTDVAALLAKVTSNLNNLRGDEKDLASFLLQRLMQLHPNPGTSISGSSSWFASDNGKFLEELFKWVKPKRRLGKGTTGTVYKAMWLGMPIAKKTFQGTKNPDFMKEVEILAKLCHSNITSIYCCAMDKRKCSIVMELMDEDLCDLIERRLEERNDTIPFTILEAIDIMHQIGEGVNYLHSQSIVHRDLKSSNILVKGVKPSKVEVDTGYVQVKVADFGLSKMKDSSTTFSDQTSNIGTSRWMPPEIINLEPSSQECAFNGASRKGEDPKFPFKGDIYSFAMVCYEILSGDKPFHDVSLPRKLKEKVKNGERPYLPQYCPKKLKILIERCWNPIPKEQPSSTEVCSELKYLKYLLMTDGLITPKDKDSSIGKKKKKKNFNPSRNHCESSASTSTNEIPAFQKQSVPEFGQPAQVQGGQSSELNAMPIAAPSLLDGKQPVVHLGSSTQGTAGPMMKDFVQDLVVLNDQMLQDTSADLRQRHVMQGMQRRIDEYRVVLKKMEAKLRELPIAEEETPIGGLLYWFCPAVTSSTETHTTIYTVLKPMIYNPLDSSTKIVIASLEACERQLLEISRLYSQGFEVFNLQCSFLVDTLSSAASERFHEYKATLQRLQDLKVKVSNDFEDSDINQSKILVEGVEFCIMSLSEQASNFQSVLDLLTMCCREKWWITALELSSATPSHWSRFFLAIRACEWSMDVVEVAFHALQDLILQSDSLVLYNIASRWSEEQCRMVLEIDSNTVKKISPLGLLAVTRELEAKDTILLAQKLAELVEDKPLKNPAFTDSEKNIAKFLCQKLNGPTPRAGYLPWTFRISSSSISWKYKSRWFGQKVAVKTQEGLNRRKFEEEAAAFAAIQHPFVVRMIGCAFETTTKMGGLVIERLEDNLWEVIKKQCSKRGPRASPFPLVVAIDIVLQIAEGMQYLHEQEILYKNLKARNVLLNQCGPLPYNPFNAAARKETRFLVKLADFVIAKARPVQSGTRMAQVIRTEQYLTGVLPWRAPEIFHVPDSEIVQNYKRPADVYSFAMTCYETLTGRKPFDGVPSERIHEFVVAGDRPSLEGVNISPTFRDLIKRCWATDPCERPSFSEICQTLWRCKVETSCPSTEWVKVAFVTE